MCFGSWWDFECFGVIRHGWYSWNGLYSQNALVAFPHFTSEHLSLSECEAKQTRLIFSWHNQLGYSCHFMWKICRQNDFATLALYFVKIKIKSFFLFCANIGKGLSLRDCWQTQKASEGQLLRWWLSFPFWFLNTTWNRLESQHSIKVESQRCPPALGGQGSNIKEIRGCVTPWDEKVRSIPGSWIPVGCKSVSPTFWRTTLIGTDAATKTDEFSEKLQKAFAPPPHFLNIILKIFHT